MTHQMKHPGPRLDEDHHVHSVFSDGIDTVEANLAAAQALGLTHLGFVDHVRKDTTYVASYVAAVTALRNATDIRLSIGVEAKLLDATGQLDLPSAPLLAGVDLVYVADHQFPGNDGPVSPRIIRAEIEAGARRAEDCVETLVLATIGSMRMHSARPLVLAHLFSILPKMGLHESDVAEPLLDDIVAVAASTGTAVEMSERWRTPSAAFIERCLRMGVRVVASTDSHRASDIARYDYVRDIVTGVRMLPA
ncbi:MAG: hypothetical protein JWM95_5294 [Gemmatimonadetes bacterium]|nr:hypothetical protein [Gemmatimonadota bacterium]